MEIIKFILDPFSGAYLCTEGSTAEMLMLGIFFDGHFSCSSYLYGWAKKAADGDVIIGNCTQLEIQRDDIVLQDMSPEEGQVAAILRMKKKQFIKLCDEWRNVVGNATVFPKELAILYENGEYRLEVAKEQFNFKVFIWKYLYKIRYSALNKKDMREIVKFIVYQGCEMYSHREESNIDMHILGQFFEGCFSCSSYMYKWLKEAKDEDEFWQNSIILEVEEDDILLKDRYLEEGGAYKELKMKKKQLIKLCDEWRNIMCKISFRPKRLSILCENDEYRVQVKKEQFSLNLFICEWFFKIKYFIFNRKSTLEIVNFIKNSTSDTYSCKDESNKKMRILGDFFKDNFCNSSFFCNWVLQAKDGNIVSGSSISLEIEQDHVLLQDMFPKEGEALFQVKIKKIQFIKLCKEWIEAVCEISTRPKELAIVYENGDYRLEITKKLFSFKAFINRWFY